MCLERRWRGIYKAMCKELRWGGIFKAMCEELRWGVYIKHDVLKAKVRGVYIKQCVKN